MAEAKKSYKPVINPQKCGACAICTRGCPAELIPAQRKEGTSLRGLIYQKFYRGTKEFPFLEMGEKFPLPACEQACPLHQDIGEYEKAFACFFEALRIDEAHTGREFVLIDLTLQPKFDEARLFAFAARLPQD